MYSTLKVYKH